MMNTGIYIHIPFCRKKCLYCDFASYVCDNHSEYFKCLMKEADMYKDILSANNADSIFIGGGTPSSVNEKYITGILEKIKRTEDCEITLEANPGTLTREKLKAYRDAGINRLSIGLQSANDNELLKLGRIHKFDDFLRSYELAVSEGFGNINIDIMFGIPDQTVESFEKTLNNVYSLSPTHISCYSLIIEEGTPFFNMKLNLPDEEEERNMYSMIVSNNRGYKRYEISNFAKKGYECRHNIKYWRFRDFLGIGAGAYSFFNGERFSNFSDLGSYISALEKDELPVCERERETRDELIKDYIITGLRMSDGIEYSDFQNRFGLDFAEKYSCVTEKFILSGHLRKTEKGIAFSDKGFEVSNYILSEMI